MLSLQAPAQPDLNTNGWKCVEFSLIDRREKRSICCVRLVCSMLLTFRLKVDLKLSRTGLHHSKRPLLKRSYSGSSENMREILEGNAIGPSCI